MKKEIHPKLNNVVFVDVSTNEEYATKSTLTSNDKKTINGIEYYVIPVQISSSSHPFYTGKHRIIDTENLVEKFEKKAQKAVKLSDKLKASKDKKESRKSKVTQLQGGDKLTLKDMLKQIK